MTIVELEKGFKCFCGTEGFKFDLNGFEVYLCNSHYDRWRHFNGKFLDIEFRRFQKRIRDMSEEWYEEVQIDYERYHEL